MENLRLTKIKAGWAAHGDGWAVHGSTREDAISAYRAAVEQLQEILRREDRSQEKEPG